VDFFGLVVQLAHTPSVDPFAELDLHPVADRHYATDFSISHSTEGGRLNYCDVDGLVWHSCSKAKNVYILR